MLLGMSVAIDDVLNRRNDLSTFIAHFTRASAGATAAENLRSILGSRRLEARTPFGWARTQAASAGGAVAASQSCVCFSEAPLEHLYSLVTPVAGRQVRLEPYGVALTKYDARRIGVNPVWYVDMTPGHDWAQARALDRLRDDAFVDDFTTHPAASVLPFFESMGTWRHSRREFAWEREWRKIGDVPLPLELPVLWLCPEDQIKDFAAAARQRREEVGNLPVTEHFVDPRWSTDRIISSLMTAGGARERVAVA
jgi:hypothetical protein